MTASRPPTSRIVGYMIGRKVNQREIPSTIPVKAHEVVGVLGDGTMQYMVPPGVDILELGLIAQPGQFVLLPYNAYQETLWNETVTLVVTAEQAAVQRGITTRFFEALLAQLPHDADDLKAGVAVMSKREELHPVFGILRRAAIETWARERRTSDPLDEAECKRLEVAVACRAAAALRESEPRCHLDRESLRSLQVMQLGCQWDRILASVAQGDYEDAVVRVLARAKIGRGLKMPISCILQILPGVERLDIFFAILIRATEHPVQALDGWLQHNALGSDPASAELAVRVLFAIWRMEADPVAANSMMPTHVERVQCEPISADARRIKLWLATVPKVQGSYVVSDDHQPLFDGMDDALERWERALVTTIDEIIMSLPERTVTRR